MLRKRILQTLEKQGNIDQRKLARIAGLSESSISRYLHGYEEVNFESILKMVKDLYPENEVEYMAEYVVTQKSRNARYSLEYCLMNHLTEEFNQLLEVLAASTNPLDKEWASMYGFIKLRNERVHSSLELLELVEVFKPKYLEMQILKGIVKGYIYVDLNDYNSLKLYTLQIEPQIGQISSYFIRNSFNVRFGLIMNYVSLYSNDIEKARYYSSLVIEQDFFEHVKAAAYHNMGHSYMFESYDEAKHYFEKAIQLFDQHNQEELLGVTLRTLSFTQSFWKIDRPFPFELKGYQEQSEYIYYLIQKGDKEHAQHIIDQIDENSIPDWNKGFYYYYKGLINDERDFFYDSVEWFKKKGDHFHLLLPLKELQRLKENARLLNLLTT